MGMHYTSKDGRFSTEIVEDTEVGCIEKLVDFQNLMERNNQCGLCKSEEVFWNIREVDDSRYYEKKCAKCGAALPYHCNKEKVKRGGLYFSWKDKWEKWTPKPAGEADEEVAAKPTKGGGKK